MRRFFDVDFIAEAANAFSELPGETSGVTAREVIKVEVARVMQHPEWYRND